MLGFPLYSLSFVLFRIRAFRIYMDIWFIANLNISTIHSCVFFRSFLPQHEAREVIVKKFLYRELFWEAFYQYFGHFVFWLLKVS